MKMPYFRFVSDVTRFIEYRLERSYPRKTRKLQKYSSFTCETYALTNIIVKRI